MGFETLQAFLDRGGPVLLVIMFATFVMWALILERVFYFRFAHQAVVDEALAEWRTRSDHSSVFAHWVKDRLVSEVRQSAETNITYTKAAVALAPLSAGAGGLRQRRPEQLLHRRLDHLRNLRVSA